MTDIETIRRVLSAAIDDEYKARATYRKVLETFGEARPFDRIVESEGRHIEALLGLFAKYGIPAPPDPWLGAVPAPPSLADACAEAVAAEIENASLYEGLLRDAAGFPDVQHVLERLQDASQTRHLPAFQRCVSRETGRMADAERAGAPDGDVACGHGRGGRRRRRLRRRGGEAGS
jgi:rubrerythrin